MRLKTKRANEEYPRHVCAASRCDDPSVVVYDVRDRFGCAVPMCDRHWASFCEDEDGVVQVEESRSEKAGAPIQSSQLGLFGVT